MAHVPLRAQGRVRPGNTSDMSVISEVEDDLGGWRPGRVVTVIDRGFSSDANQASLTRAGGHWMAGMRSLR